jgi:fatty acid desaturase
MIKIFTCVHEGSHQLLSRNKVVNEVLFFLLWPLFPFGPHLFRSLHLVHHAATGQKGVDLDVFTHGKSNFTSMIRSTFMIWYCLFFFLSSPFRKLTKLQRSLLWPNRMTLIFHLVNLIGQFLLIVLSFRSDYAIPFAFSWFIPSMVGIAITTYYDAYLTHKGCLSNSKENSARNFKVHPLMEWLLCYQNYHQVHHRNPKIPWFQYQFEIEKNNQESKAA